MVAIRTRRAAARQYREPAPPSGGRSLEEPTLILKKQPGAPPAGASGRVAHDSRAPAVTSRPSQARLPGGTILQGRYRIVDTLGAGGMSVVYKALDLHFTNVERVCAVKEMFDPVADERARQTRLANFEREAGLLAILSHPLIPKIFDFFSEHGRIYLVQEFIPGSNLEILVNQTVNGFPEHEVIEWGAQICDVLSYLHAQKPAPIIFRDMKPSNIMMRDDRSVMLIDFGIARTFLHLQRGTMIGTEGYAPPEQYRGIADARGDVYALGATLHHLATGNDPRFETPFTFDQRKPRALNPALSPQFEAVVMKAVSYTPADRYASAAEFKEALLECRLAPRESAWPERPESVVRPARPRPIPTRALSPHSGPMPASIVARAPRRGAAAVAEPATSAVPAPVTERLAWVAVTGDEVRGTGALADALLVIGSYDGYLYGLDAEKGRVRWRFPTGRGICSTPAIWHDLAIVGGEDGAVYGVTLDDGQQKWRYRTNMPVRSSPRVTDLAVFIGSDDSYVYKLDAARGDLLWRYRTYGPVRSSPALAEDLAVIGSDDGFIYALAQADGRQVWRFATARPVLASPVVDGNLVVCSSLDGSVYGLGLAEGELHWRFETGGPVVATAALRDGKVYLGSTDGHFYALDARTGERIWEVSHGGRVTSSAVATQERIYYGGLDGSVYCLERATGSLSWSFTIGRPVPASPILFGGLLVIGGTDGKVYALATGEHLVNGDW